MRSLSSSWYNQPSPRALWQYFPQWSWMEMVVWTTIHLLLSLNEFVTWRSTFMFAEPDLVIYSKLPRSVLVELSFFRREDSGPLGSMRAAAQGGDSRPEPKAHGRISADLIVEREKGVRTPWRREKRTFYKHSRVYMHHIWNHFARSTPTQRLESLETVNSALSLTISSIIDN